MLRKDVKMKRTITFNKVSSHWSKFSAQDHLITLELELRGKNGKFEFSCCGNLWNNRHSDILQGGQCVDSLWDDYSEQIKDKKLYFEIMELWKKYHLNGMNADCKHRINEKLAKKQLKITKMRWTEEGKKLSKIRDFGIQFIKTENIDLVPSALYELDTYSFRPEAVETTTAGWIHCTPLTPSGVLAKPCPKCGYEYGTSWNYRPIPKKALTRIRQLIEKGA